MENFIATIYLKLNSYTEDKISVGLFYTGKHNAFFKWSEQKLKMASKFYEPSTEKVLNRKFKNFKKIIDTNTNSLIQEHPFKYGHLSHLNKVDNGLIFYEEPKPIAKELDAKKFEKLFNLYVEGRRETKPKKHSDFHHEIKHKLATHPVFKERSDIDFRISPTVIKSIYRAHKVDFISVNGGLLAGFVLDFDQNPNTIENKLYEYRALTEGFKDFSENNKLNPGRYLAFYNNPGDEEKGKLLESALKDNTLPFELKEAEKLEETGKLLESREYQKFSEYMNLEES